MSVYIIKLAALTSMLIDHSGVIMQRSGLQDTGAMLRHMGRLAFPLYAFLIGIGVKHTKNIKKYLGRLLLFAFISEIPYDLFRKNINKNPGALIIFDFSSQNVFFTLFLGALALGIYFYSTNFSSKGTSFFFGSASAFTLAMMADFAHTDYSWGGVVLISIPVMVADFAQSPLTKKAVQCGLMAFFLYLINIDNSLSYFYWGLLSLLFTLIYNGKKGPPIKWLFYWAYPLHLVIYYIIWKIFVYGS